MKYLLISLTRITVVLLLIGAPFSAAAEDTSRRVVDVYLFWEAGCPHCQREIEFLSQWQHQETRLRINSVRNQARLAQS